MALALKFCQSGADLIRVTVRLVLPGASDPNLLGDRRPNPLPLNPAEPRYPVTCLEGGFFAREDGALDDARTPTGRNAGFIIIRQPI